MKRTVFVSSTFDDLKDHRRKVWDTVEQYDVNVRGMEKFGARTEKPLETSLAEVGQSDVYVGIIGYRLGTVDKITGKSITQLEYEKAYELRERYNSDKRIKKSMEILIYFMDERDSRIAPSSIDFGENHEKLNAFKSILRENHTIATFADEDRLAESLRIDLDRLLTKRVPEKEGRGNEYEISVDKIYKFTVLPKKYSGTEVKLMLRLNRDPFPASRSVCDAFNLTYGATLGYDISFMRPEMGQRFLDYGFVTQGLVESFLGMGNGDVIEVYAKLLFSEADVPQYEARFLAETHQWASVGSLSAQDFGMESIRPEGSMIILITKVF